MAKTKIKEVDDRIFHRVFICMKCGAKNRGDLIRIREGKVKCRKCSSHQLRKIHKDKKA